MSWDIPFHIYRIKTITSYFEYKVGGADQEAPDPGVDAGAGAGVPFRDPRGEPLRDGHLRPDQVYTLLEEETNRR